MARKKTENFSAGPNRSDVVARVIFRVLKEGVANIDLQAPLAATTTGAPASTARNRLVCVTIYAI